jgi:hypothetical protein
MYKLVAAAVVALAPLGAAQAFQVITPGQMQDAGMGFTQSRAFNQQVDPQTDPAFQFSAFGNGRRYGTWGSERPLSYNRFGRMDNGGRYLGDDMDSNFKSCSDYADSNAAQLDSLARGGNSYPCQRFR